MNKAEQIKQVELKPSEAIQLLSDKIGHHFNDVIFCNECRDYFDKDYKYCPDCNFSVNWPDKPEENKAITGAELR